LAIDEELVAHRQCKTWDVVKEPPGGTEIQSRWIFRLKTKADGRVDRFKARLVACGFSQKAGADFKEIFAPVVRMDGVRLILSVSVQQGLKWRQSDIKTAFLAATWTKKYIYLRLPDLKCLAVIHSGYARAFMDSAKHQDAGSENSLKFLRNSTLDNSTRINVCLYPTTLNLST